MCKSEKKFVRDRVETSTNPKRDTQKRPVIPQRDLNRDWPWNAETQGGKRTHKSEKRPKK